MKSPVAKHELKCKLMSGGARVKNKRSKATPIKVLIKPCTPGVYGVAGVKHMNNIIRNSVDEMLRGVGEGVWASCVVYGTEP